MASLERRRGRRHLEPAELASTVHRGASVAQLLGWSAAVRCVPTARHLHLQRVGAAMVLTRHHVFCETTGELFDVAEFEDVDP